MPRTSQCQVWANLSRLPRPCYMLPSHPAPVIPQSQYTAAVARWAPGTTQQYSATAAACPRVIRLCVLAEDGESRGGAVLAPGLDTGTCGLELETNLSGLQPLPIAHTKMLVQFFPK